MSDELTKCANYPALALQIAMTRMDNKLGRLVPRELARETRETKEHAREQARETRQATREAARETREVTTLQSV